MNYTERIDGFQICDPTYLGPPPKDAPLQYDVVKWEQHAPIEALEWKTGKRIMMTESCYVVGWLKWDSHEGSFDFYSCGLRWLEARPTDAVIDMVLKFAEERTEKILEAERWT